MKRFMAFALIVGFLVAADDPKKDKGKDDKEKLQGTWVAVSAERGGEKVPDDQAKGFKLLIKDDQITFYPEKRISTFRLDRAKKPKQISLVPTDGPRKGETITGIYALDGDSLKICVNNRDAKPMPPAEFGTKKGDGLGLFILKREKP